ncbi:heavy-metal-associated domain-containing protein [Candidatus Falkowbacteria bacterium]|nr:heavy-metal-associated domain-containing protein [Candidatus Falkowbacteria bacterium]
MNIFKLKLAGLTCEACVKLVTKRLKSIAGVENVSINLSTGQTEITAFRPINPEEVTASLTNSPYSIIN